MHITIIAAIASLLVLESMAGAQTLRSGAPAQTSSSTAGLPDAPSARTSAKPEGGRDISSWGTSKAPIRAIAAAGRYQKYIEPGQIVPPLSAGDKVVLGLRELASPLQLVTITSAAAYEHAVNGSPNYGTNLGAYEQRVGAAAIRDASRTIFTDSIAAPLLREDPRYYILGSTKNPVIRAGYAISRVFVTRTDSGNSSPNYALFAGYGGVALLNNAFYPPDNRGVSETVKGFAGSLGGAARQLRAGVSAGPAASRALEKAVTPQVLTRARRLFIGRSESNLNRSMQILAVQPFVLSN